MDINKLTALELGHMIKNGGISAVEALEETFKNIDRQEKEINAYTAICREEAFQRAHEVQQLIDDGVCLPPVAGVPMAIKDNICIKGMAATCSSKMLESHRPLYDATAAKKLLDSGAILMGKCNMDEFAMGASTETSFQGTTKNPWNTRHVAGGSSGGSAAAVAASECYYTLGSDTGGSIRQPCSFCGVTGIKPTYGAVSRFGLVAYASSLDQIGPIGKDIRDCAQVLQLISGPDPMDPTAVMEKPFHFQAMPPENRLKIGIPLEYFEGAIDPEVKKSVLEAAVEFKKAGMDVSEFSLSGGGFQGASLNDCAVAAYYIIACAEASSNLARYDGIKYGFRAEGESLSDSYIETRTLGFGREVKRRILLGSFVLSAGYYDAYYKKALKVRRLLKDAFDYAFQSYDLILAPVSPGTAPPAGGETDDPLQKYLGDIYTVSVNLAGLPAVSLPCGFHKNGLPIGLQLIGKAFAEETLINAGILFQDRTGWHQMTPEGRL